MFFTTGFPLQTKICKQSKTEIPCVAISFKCPIICTCQDSFLWKKIYLLKHAHKKLIKMYQLPYKLKVLITVQLMCLYWQYHDHESQIQTFATYFFHCQCDNIYLLQTIPKQNTSSFKWLNLLKYLIHNAHEYIPCSIISKLSYICRHSNETQSNIKY